MAWKCVGFSESEVHAELCSGSCLVKWGIGTCKHKKGRGGGGVRVCVCERASRGEWRGRVIETRTA